MITSWILATRARRMMLLGLVVVAIAAGAVVAAATGRVLLAIAVAVVGVAGVLGLKLVMVVFVGHARLERSNTEMRGELQRLTDDSAAVEGRLTLLEQQRAEQQAELQAQIARLTDSLASIEESLRESERSGRESRLELERSNSESLALEIRRERIRTNLAFARLRAESQTTDGVVLLMTPQRAGSTRAFDMLRTHPNIEIDRSCATWESLGLKGRRYPAALSNHSGDSFEIEVQPGVGAVIGEPQTFGDSTGGRSWFLEKAHPEFIDFDEVALADAVEQLRRKGVDVRLVYATRRPFDAMWSMAEYKQRDPQWYRWLALQDIPSFVCRSYETLSRLADLVQGVVLDYDQGVGVGSPLQSLGADLGVADSEAWVSSALTWVTNRSAGIATDRKFVGDRDAERSRSGPNELWIGQEDTLDTAHRCWQRLVGERGVDRARSPADDGPSSSGRGD